ncbi:MAG: hypothetical protein J6S89_00680 [Paludibacteraceae bacterium]|nr:hypothetical protein [Paludibacteraceae bacterium]
MKAIKIILAVVVVAVLGFFVWKWIIAPPPPPPTPTPPTNQFVERIEKEIDSLAKVPSASFCPEFHQKIQYDISEFHLKGFLGDTTTSDNDQWEEILSKNLYSVYAPKFVEQAMFIFNGHEWKTDDLKFIRNEAKELQKSDNLKSDSPVKASFVEIEDILSKYDEISNFLGMCNRFGAASDELAIEFPDASEKVEKANGYIKRNLDNKYVNNCTRLKDGLREIPRILFDKHIAYLTKKINLYANQYRNYETQAEYNDKVYSPLRNQINGIDYKVYGMGESFVEDKQEELFNLLGTYNRKATDHFLLQDSNN